MSPRKIWPVVALLLMTGGATTAQEKEDDAHNRVQVKLEMLTLHDGLPGGPASVRVISVGDHLGKQTSMRRDTSGKVVYRRTIEGQSRWLPDNAIEITLEITENDVKRTETILLEGFEPKTLVLREDPTHGRRELPKSPGDSTKNDPAASLYSPGLGRFILSSVPFEGATEGELRFNQLSFTLEGKSYLLLTGGPISSSQSIWVVHQPFWHLSASELSAFGDQPMVSVSSLRVLLDSR